jgi:isopentenyl-diphosphate delta-isomerase type 1
MPKDSKTETFIIVNKSDKIIGYETRFHCHHNPKFIHRAVDIVIFNDNKQILLQKRSRFKDTNPGFYGLSTAGHVAPGETYRQAAFRELKEEVGITVKLVYKGKHLYRDERESEMTGVFFCYFNGPFTIDKTEVESVAFFSPQKITMMIEKLTPGAIFTLNKLHIIST